MIQAENALGISGYISANMGLGHTARTFSRLALDKGFPISLRDIDPGHDRAGQDNSLSEHYRVCDSGRSSRIELAVGGADALTGWMLDSAIHNIAEDTVNAAFVWWELPHLPEHWIEACRAFDVLIAGSEFIYSTLANSGANVPVLLAQHPLDIPQAVVADRDHFALPASDFVVFMGFEPLSNSYRKNPFAAIEAFKRAFPGRSGFKLVIKVNNAHASHAGTKLWVALADACKSDPRIIILTDSLSYQQLLSLYAGCDAFISLHRSEGSAYCHWRRCAWASLSLRLGGQVT